jgi:uncharacterized protein involved in response to NO
MVVDLAFPATLAFAIWREVVAGSNWKNAPVALMITLFGAANAADHFANAGLLDHDLGQRLALAVAAMLMALIGGRIVPSFTRNWLVKAGADAVPVPFNRFDMVTLALLLPALAVFVVLPTHPATALLALAASALHAVRLMRWRGRLTLDEPLLLALNVAYGFVPIGLAAVAASAMGWIAQASALHVLTVGAIGGMTLAIMTRASLGHTGRPLTASPLTCLCYLCLLLSAAIRPFAELIGTQYHLLLSLAGAGWLLAFGLFVLEYGPMLLAPRR